MSVKPTHWANLGLGECTDKPSGGDVYAHGPAPAMASSLAACKAACVKGQSLCAGINWLLEGDGQPGINSCMIQARKGPSKEDIEKAIGTPLASWWTACDPTLPILGANNHNNGDWTTKATCWALKSGAGDSPQEDAGLGWTLVLLLLGGLSAYVILGALHTRLTTKPSQRQERWPLLPHRAFWTSVFDLFMDGTKFARGGFRGRGGGGERQPQRGSSAGSSGNIDDRARRQSSASGTSRASKSSRGSSRSKSSSNRKSSKSKRTKEPLLPDPPPEQVAAVAAPGMASGGGGRWVRVVD